LATAVAFSITHYIKSRSTWTGTVVGKDILKAPGRSSGKTVESASMENGHTEVDDIRADSKTAPQAVEHHFIQVKSVRGDVVKWHITKAMYQSIQIGDIVEKSAGSNVPRVVSAQIGARAADSASAKHDGTSHG
jgi:hypothetical protein